MTYVLIQYEYSGSFLQNQYQKKSRDLHQMQMEHLYHPHPSKRKSLTDLMDWLKKKLP